MRTLYINTDDPQTAIQVSRTDPNQWLTAIPTHDKQNRPAYLVKDEQTNRKTFVIVKG